MENSINSTVTENPVVEETTTEEVKTFTQEYNIQELHDYAESVLQDDEYCESAWKHKCEIK